MIKILVVDDDPSFNSMVCDYLRRQQYEVVGVFSSKSALSSFKENKFDLVLTDFRLPDLDGLELIKRIKEEQPQLPVILITNYSDLRTAVTSIKLGAYEFVTKPVIPDELLITIEQALKANDEKTATKSSLSVTDQEPNIIIGNSPNSKTTWEHLQLVAPTKMTVLVLGESGTGKEYAARMIHKKSKRSSMPFIAIDCGVLSKELAASELFGYIKGAFTGALLDKTGCFEQANNGTIFLDEIGNLTYEVQVQLLRAIEERSIRRIGSNKDIAIDVRIIAATNDNLKNQSEEINFRTDLYHRLNEFELHITPLRENLEDLGLYIKHFLREACNELQKEVSDITPEVLEVMKKYNWPGNLRELRNVIKRSVLLSTTSTITINQLPADIINFRNETVKYTQSEDNNTTNLKIIQKNQEKALIIQLLEETKHNKSKTAQLLNIDRKTLYNKLVKYQIEV